MPGSPSAASLAARRILIPALLGVAALGAGSTDAGRIHRIDEEYARRDFEKRGFTFVAKSDVLRRPDDPRDQITYKGPMVGKTDRFAMVLRKQR
ncbi:MAG: hypothetical protein E6K34_14225 [Gammaproteobacteria bacterium]|nr:MAG: hypothetical protein E6K34_14225 [Gammaproteobacteria bacterium]TLZ30156.1 MAG: hypothetical protein E6K25_08605 [Gammaproteobacteria bacterium]TLZ50380.1 MAG: hypothetical protein E6K21_03000 [Gammaproteobacteria bacterium]